VRRLGFLLAFHLASCEPKEPADTVLLNGKLVTLDAAGTIAQAVAVRGDRILAVGTNEAVLEHASSATERIDLEGKTVVPGLADNHYHSIGGGPGVDLSRTRTLQQVLDAIAARARETPEGEVVVTNSDWHEGQLAEQRLPYRDDLDRATTLRPVVVVRGGHEYILNSPALAKFGIAENAVSPPGGSVGRYPDGRLNGELVDTAKKLVTLPVPRELSEEERLQALVDEYRRLNSVGLTSIRYAGVSPAFYRDLEALEKTGKLSLRVSALLRVADPAALDSLGIAPDAGDDWVRVAGIKLGVDGGFEGGLMREPYEEPWGRKGTFRGLQTVPTDTYTDLVRTLNQKGWRVATHAVGDAAIDLVLDAYEKANQDRSITDRRFAIEHGFIPREDQFPRMKALGLYVTAQDHLYLAAPSLVKYWGAERAKWMTPLRAYLDAGIPVSLGTDTPVVPYPPLWVLYHFVTRDTISAGVMGEDQKVSREEALRAMTQGGAALTFEESSKGTLERGKLADLVVLDEDILTCAPEHIRDMGIALTMVGGRVVFRHAPSKRGGDREIRGDRGMK
jgi:predicted amidohydrolase YtcJ